MISKISSVGRWSIVALDSLSPPRPDVDVRTLECILRLAPFLRLTGSQLNALCSLEQTQKRGHRHRIRKVKLAPSKKRQRL